MLPIPRSLTVTAAVAAIMSFSAAGVSAQSRCGPTYEVAHGDTLYGISQSCRVAIARIMDLNPSLGNPRDIEVGTRLQLVAGVDRPRQGSGDRSGRDRRRYEVREGDTLNEIAQRFGVSILELISQNGDFDPSDLDIGQVIGIPDDRPNAMVSVSPRSGTPASEVTVSARNLRPNDYVTIGAGQRAAEWTPLREVPVGRDGEISAEVSLPEFAEAGDTLIFVVDTDRGLTLKSDPFDVTTARKQRFNLEGRVERGRECPELVTSDGDRYALAGSNPPITIGEYVEISGVRAPAYCAEDMTSIDVYDLREVAPPEGGSDPVDMLVEGRIREGTECPMIVTPDGDRYALVGYDFSGTAGEYVEIRGTRAEVSYCMQGRATIEVGQLRETEPPARDRDPDRAGGQPLTRGYLTGGWAAKGSDCARPDFDISSTSTGALTVETSLNEAPRTGFVVRDDEPAFIFDQPRRELPLETRGVDGLAVMPPDSGAVRLGGENITGDGVVFIRCG